MARGTQFLQIVMMLRDELGRSNDVAVGVDDLPALKQTINRVYSSLYDEYDWPHLRSVFPKQTLYSGQRYYDLPATLNYDRIERVAVWYGGIPHPLPRGIDFDEYASFDSNSDVRSEPALRWDVRWTGSAEQLEIWPIPNSNQQSLQIIGVNKIPKLVNDIDVCLLDDMLVVLFAAAELLQRQKSGDAEAKLKQAQARFNRFKARVSNDTMVRLGMGDGRQSINSGRATVRVR